MTFSGFTDTDFDVFKINGLDERMKALITHIRPKLEGLGHYFAPILSLETGDEIFPHVAKHARRTKNPPQDTWVAFASNPRGYKMLPHFQIGLWETHVFIWFALIYEAPNKEIFGKKLEANINKIYKQTPKNFVWSVDHTKPEAKVHGNLSKEELHSMFVRLQKVKKAEILCGLHISKEEAIRMSPENFLQQAESVFKTLLPLYKLA
ncbi:DUF1054 domain-containing protein [Bacillus sp. FJAT-49705]|uniref:UPF0637 protein KHA94_02405 n=1 Tax=Cytobacillus citreus TaxID=2833586 RepID=A0ABS5NMN4_9BACI|nr:DUF1054 domain-containing protein [Cytobacillus citreus]MBS4189067.1 DUF1054 domain-containing protein [Cytobacillus citreus]